MTPYNPIYVFRVQNKDGDWAYEERCTASELWDERGYGSPPDSTEADHEAEVGIFDEACHVIVHTGPRDSLPENHVLREWDVMNIVKAICGVQDEEGLVWSLRCEPSGSDEQMQEEGRNGAASEAFQNL